jgi:hypothetical protein
MIPEDKTLPGIGPQRTVASERETVRPTKAEVPEPPESAVVARSGPPSSAPPVAREEPISEVRLVASDAPPASRTPSTLPISRVSPKKRRRGSVVERIEISRKDPRREDD